MKHSTKKHFIAGESNNSSQKPQKHDANLQKNSTFYFQIGLIVCLLMTFILFEMKFESKAITIAQLPPLDNDEEIDIKNYKELKEVTKPFEPIQKAQKLGANNIIIKENEFDGLEIKNILITEPEPTTNPIDPGSIKIEKVTEDIPIPWNNLEKVPVYPGCESAKNNEQRTKCMSKMLAKLVQNKFDQNLFSELGLLGIQKIDVQFKIDKTGNVIEIIARAPHIQLENEALRIAKKIPNMEPGLQRAKPVSVIYNLPIRLKAQ